MKAPLRLILALVTLLAPALAQSPAKLKQELRTKEAAAKKDPEALFEVGQWAADKAMASDAKRIFLAVLKLQSDHSGANEALGNELVDGKWLPAKEADALRKKLMAAEFAAKGYVEVAGVWVQPEHVDDAKRGIFHHEDELVTKDEKLALLKGMVRHPDTGELIDAKHLEQATKRYFPIGSRWVDEKEADQFHSDLKRPWIVRSTYCTLLSTLAIAKIQDLRTEADAAIERVKPLFGGALPSPDRRPIILIAATDAEFRALGESVGDGTDACGAALMEEKATLRIPGIGDVRAAFCHNEKDWGTRYLRHAAAIAYAHAVAADREITLPLWFLHGVASYTSRFQIESDASGFGKQHIQKGGVRNLKGFFSGFDISGERMEPLARDANIYQAGLMFAFAASGGDEAVTAALQEVTRLLDGTQKGKADKAIGKLEAALVAAEPKIVTYLQDLTTKAH
jgi:hypothetical protein